MGGMNDCSQYGTATDGCAAHVNVSNFKYLYFSIHIQVSNYLHASNFFLLIVLEKKNPQYYWHYLLYIPNIAVSWKNLHILFVAKESFVK